MKVVLIFGWIGRSEIVKMFASMGYYTGEHKKQINKQLLYDEDLYEHIRLWFANKIPDEDERRMRLIDLVIDRIKKHDKVAIGVHAVCQLRAIIEELIELHGVNESDIKVIIVFSRNSLINIEAYKRIVDMFYGENQQLNNEFILNFKLEQYLGAIEVCKRFKIEYIDLRCEDLVKKETIERLLNFVNESGDADMIVEKIKNYIEERKIILDGG